MKKNKKCYMCGEVKSLEEYYKDATNTTGASSKCKPCHLKYKAEWQKENRDKYKKYKRNSYMRKKYRTHEEYIADLKSKYESDRRKKANERIKICKRNAIMIKHIFPTERQCTKCGEFKHIFEYPREKKHVKVGGYTYDRFRTECKGCKSKLSRDAVKRWNEKNPQKVKDMSHRGTLKRREKKKSINDRYPRKAVRSEIYKRFDNKCYNCGSKELLCIDHHMPLSMGYRLTKDNAVLLCNGCNCTKGASHPMSFYNEIQIAELKEKYNINTHENANVNEKNLIGSLGGYEVRG